MVVIIGVLLGMIAISLLLLLLRLIEGEYLTEGDKYLGKGTNVKEE